MSSKEAKRRRDQSERDRKKEQARRDLHLHDEAVLQPHSVAQPPPSEAQSFGVGHNRGPPLGPDPDRPVWGARAIAIAAGLVDGRGKPECALPTTFSKRSCCPRTKSAAPSSAHRAACGLSPTVRLSNGLPDGFADVTTPVCAVGR
jgi:hypothetical protein